MKQIRIDEAAGFLRENDNFIVYNHAHPDGDALGSAAALVLILRACGKTAFAFSPDGVPERFDFIPNDGIFIKDPGEYCGYIPVSVDTASPSLLGNIKVPRFALSIDHHLNNTLDCELLCDISDKCACGEIIFMLASELGVEITKDIASALYAAISSDSGGFRYPATTAKTHIIAARLLETGIDFAYIDRRLFSTHTKAQTELIKLAYNKLQFVNGGRFAFVAISKAEMEACGATDDDMDCINDIPREIKGVSASAVIRSRGDGFKVSMRSSDEIDVAEIAGRFGGGGHFHASGFSLDCENIDVAADIIRKVFSEIDI